MHVTMIKKRLVNGDPCEKCAQTEEMLRRRGVWDRIDEVVWAQEGDPGSPGNVLGARHDVAVAPFFIVRDEDGAETVFTSPLKLLRTHFPEASGAARRSAKAPAPATDAARAAAEAPAFDLAEARRTLEGAEPVDVLRFAVERFGDRCRLGFSGAEEIVLIDMAVRHGLPLRVFTLDTGRLHGETYAYLDDVRRRYGLEIEVFLPDDAALTAFVREKGMNSFYRDGHRECCAIRKVAPLARALAGCEAWVTGRRRDQSPATRHDLAVVDTDPRHVGPRGPLVTLNPLAGWDHERVFDYVRRHDVPTNPLHEAGFASIGCEPCTRAITPDQSVRAGRWWWEAEGARESGLHLGGDGI